MDRKDQGRKRRKSKRQENEFFFGKLQVMPKPATEVTGEESAPLTPEKEEEKEKKEEGKRKKGERRT